MPRGLRSSPESTPAASSSPMGGLRPQDRGCEVWVAAREVVRREPIAGFVIGAAVRCEGSAGPRLLDGLAENAALGSVRRLSRPPRVHPRVPLRCRRPGGPTNGPHGPGASRRACWRGGLRRRRGRRRTRRLAWGHGWCGLAARNGTYGFLALERRVDSRHRCRRRGPHGLGRQPPRGHGDRQDVRLPLTCGSKEYTTRRLGERLGGVPVVLLRGHARGSRS